MRIVSLVPHATELLFALGLGPEVVGVTHECDHPPGALELPRITRDVLAGGLSAGEIDAAVRERTLEGEAIYELDREALAALEPELIVTQALCPVCAVSYEEVAELALELPSEPRVISLDPNTLEETLGDARTIAEATGRDREAQALVDDAHARIERVTEAVKGRPRPRVAALEWLDPVYVAGHWTPQLIDLAGGEDVLGVAGGHSQTVSWEAVAAAEPEVVVVMPCGYDAPRAHAEAVAYAHELEGLRAARVVAVNASAYFSRPGPRLIDGLELLAHILHPECLPAVPASGEALVRLRRGRAALRSRRRSGDARAGGARDRDRPEHAERAQKDAGDEPERRHLARVRRADRERSHGAADQAADVRAHGDVGQAEAEDEVDDDQPADARLHHADAARAQLHDGRPHQAEDRAGCAQARRGGREQGAEGPGQQRYEVDGEEPERADARLEHRPEQVQQVHVEADVDEVLVQERARDEPPVLMAFGDRRPVEHAFVDDRSVDVRAEQRELSLLGEERERR